MLDQKLISRTIRIRNLREDTAIDLWTHVTARILTREKVPVIAVLSLTVIIWRRGHLKNSETRRRGRYFVKKMLGIPDGSIQVPMPRGRGKPKSKNPSEVFAKKKKPSEEQK